VHVLDLLFAGPLIILTTHSSSLPWASRPLLSIISSVDLQDMTEKKTAFSYLLLAADGSNW
jgi:hypothetical protein